jgi:hypothetical protein
MEKGRPMKQINHRPRRWTEYITRNKETEFFFRALGNGPLNSIEVLGTRSAGVTDFLQQLHRIYNHKMDATKQAQNLIMVFVSVEEVRTPADFFDKLIKATRQELKCLLEERIARSLKKELVWVGKEAISRNLVPSLIDSLVEAPAGKDASLNMEDFRTWVENLLMRFQSANFAFLIDGLDQIANHPDQFTLDFLNFLRALCRDGRLSWVVGTHRSVVEICHEISGLNRISPFSNIFSHRIILGTIDCQEAEELISVWAKERNVTINPTEIQAIQEIAGPWPRVLNAAADHWTSLKRIGMVDVKQEIIVQLLISPRLTVSGFMESYWHDLSSKEKDFLRSVINGEWQSSRSLSAQLELLGILKTTGQKTIITSRLFEEWVRTYSPVRNGPSPSRLFLSPAGSPSTFTHIAHGFPNFAQRINPVDHRNNLAGFDQLGDGDQSLSALRNHQYAHVFPRTLLYRRTKEQDLKENASRTAGNEVRPAGLQRPLHGKHRAVRDQVEDQVVLLAAAGEVLTSKSMTWSAPNERMKSSLPV